MRQCSSHLFPIGSAAARSVLCTSSAAVALQQPSHSSSLRTLPPRVGVEKTAVPSYVCTSQRRAFASGADPHRIRQLRKSLFPSAPTIGRDDLSLQFEKRIRILRMGSYPEDEAAAASPSSSSQKSGDGLQRVFGSDDDAYLGLRVGSNLQAAALQPDTAVVKFIPSVAELRENRAAYPPAVVRRIARQSDCKIMAARVGADGSHLEPIYDPVTGRAADEAIGGSSKGFSPLRRPNFASDCAANSGLQHAIVYCVQPQINSHEFRFEEAQVELIATYRNMLVDVAEARGIHRIVCPPLCLYTCGRAHRFAIAKLNQVSLIKAFHRLSPSDREELLYRCDGTFAVEIYVDDAHYSEFVATFAEEAWEPPTNLLFPERTDLYPGLAPPEGMAELEGWIGKRPELLEAIATKGTSLIDGKPKYALDGSPIVPLDATTFGRVHKTTRDERVAAEHATARLMGFVPAPLAALEGGLQGDAYVSDPKPSAAVLAEVAAEAAEAEAAKAEAEANSKWAVDAQAADVAQLEAGGK